MRSVLITGANSGFGYLMALKFARNGYKVYATTRDLKREGVKEINEIALKERLEIEWLVLDVTNEKQIKEATKDIESLDVLINNAGFGMIGPIEGYSAEEFLLQVDANLFGVHRMVRRFLPIMRKQKSGKIINIASVAGRITFPYYGLYSASKFGVEAYTEVLRSEVRSFGIDAVLVEPGTFKTGFSKRVVEGEEDIIKEYEHVGKQIGMMKDFVHKFGVLRFEANPQKVADKVYQLAGQKVSKLHNFVGFDSKMLALLRKVLPDNLWDSIVQFIVE